MEIYLIRHGRTKGNEEHRYVGRTDEDLLETGREELAKMQENMKMTECVYVSYLKRCIQTADILFPNQKYLVWDGLEEKDFGEFEYKNHEELAGDPVYQNWLAGGGRIPFPTGENQEHFKTRCIEAFIQCLVHAKKQRYERIAFVVHGGTIMSVLERFSGEKKGFYDWQVPNGCGYLVNWDEDEQKIYLQVKRKIEI